jgi:hypothetical protein
MGLNFSVKNVGGRGMDVALGRGDSKRTTIVADGLTTLNATGASGTDPKPPFN